MAEPAGYRWSCEKFTSSFLCSAARALVNKAKDYLYFALLRLKRINAKNKSIGFTSSNNTQRSNKGGNSFDETSNGIMKKITELSLTQILGQVYFLEKRNSSSAFTPDLISNMVCG